MRYNQKTKEEYSTPEVRIRDIRMEHGLCVSPTTQNEGFEEDPEFNW